MVKGFFPRNGSRDSWSQLFGVTSRRIAGRHTPIISRSAYQRLLDVMMAAGELDEAVPFDAIMTNRFAIDRRRGVTRLNTGVEPAQADHRRNGYEASRDARQPRTSRSETVTTVYHSVEGETLALERRQPYRRSRGVCLDRRAQRMRQEHAPLVDRGAAPSHRAARSWSKGSRPSWAIPRSATCSSTITFLNGGRSSTTALLGLEVRRQVTRGERNECCSSSRSAAWGALPTVIPTNFPGGMRQRAALVRTLALDPDLAPAGRTFRRPGLPDAAPARRRGRPDLEREWEECDLGDARHL